MDKSLIVTVLLYFFMVTVRARIMPSYIDWLQAEFRNQRNILCTNSSVQTETETNLVRSILSTISTV